MYMVSPQVVFSYELNLIGMALTQPRFSDLYDGPEPRSRGRRVILHDMIL